MLIRACIVALAVVQAIAVDESSMGSPRMRDCKTLSLLHRFNFLNNMWRDSEQIDVWAVRYSFDAAHRFWGFGQMTTEQASEVLQKTQVREQHCW